MVVLTHPFELLLEVGEVVALGDAEVIVRERILGDAGCRVGRADCEHCCSAIGAQRQSAADLLNAGGSSTSHG